jgi:FkbM family methyltransferase
MTLLRTLLTNTHHYRAELPYNLNWKIKVGAMSQFLAQHPVVVCDIGARGGRTLDELDPLRPYLRYYAFDADVAECARINARPPRDVLFYDCKPRFIGNGKPAAFRLYKERGYSSSLVLSSKYQREFVGPIALESTTDVETTTLDAALQDSADSVDLLKIDTQGTELEILSNAAGTLKHCFMVEVEVEFFPLYEGQATFDKVHNFMLAQGFELLYLNRVFGQKKQLYAGPARGQLVFGDALYGRSLIEPSASVERLAKYAILLANYGHLDWAYEIVSKTPAIRQVCPAVGRLFAGPKGLLKTLLVAQLDKVLCYLLHLRKFNHIRWESDRSWPIR